MKKAILEMDNVPKSCKVCDVWHYCLNVIKITIHSDQRSPDCPLKIVETEKNYCCVHQFAAIMFPSRMNKIKNKEKVSEIND